MDVRCERSVIQNLAMMMKNEILVQNMWNKYIRILKYIFQFKKKQKQKIPPTKSEEADIVDWVSLIPHASANAERLCLLLVGNTNQTQ
jgi:hypothetical protein